MNDRYLYRAKRIDNGVWVEGYLIHAKKDYYICENPYECMNEYSSLNGQSYGFGGFKLVDPSTICQCTGLMEKNGNPIFENDIVKYHFGEKYARIKYGVYQSCFDSTKTGHCGFYVDWPDSENKRKDLGYWINMVDAEIVGNIFDNPELLEVGE